MPRLPPVKELVQFLEDVGHGLPSTYLQKQRGFA
jgi:hypothetical protein